MDCRRGSGHYFTRLIVIDFGSLILLQKIRTVELDGKVIKLQIVRL